MSRAMLFAGLVLVVSVGSVLAEGVPSKSKLSQLGLSSMNVASDTQGEQVRGNGFGAIFFSFTATVTESVFDTTNNVFVVNDANTQTGFARGGLTWGQDPRATAGAVVSGSTGVDPVAPNSPFTINFAAPSGSVWTASGFGIGFGMGN